MADPMNGEPSVECEGANCPTHFTNFAEGMCQMCGQWVPVANDGTAIRHWRVDILRVVRACPNCGRMLKNQRALSAHQAVERVSGDLRAEHAALLEERDQLRERCETLHRLYMDAIDRAGGA